MFHLFRESNGKVVQTISVMTESECHQYEDLGFVNATNWKTFPQGHFQVDHVNQTFHAPPNTPMETERLAVLNALGNTPIERALLLILKQYHF